jgi:2-methylisocitrate lyase-like PEP mutase family enzyme
MNNGVTHPGQQLRGEVRQSKTSDPFIGIYDCFSATIASKYSTNLFLSGFGFSASYYGLPDIGYVSWSDIVNGAWRVRQILPNHKLLVDIDDGFVDTHTACHVVNQLENMGVAMVMLEDQARPRRCGHAEGKLILPLGAYLEKLRSVLIERTSLCVMARTDASGDEMLKRVDALSSTDADVLLVDGIDSVETLALIRANTDKPLMFNQIAGGKSPRLTLEELRDIGVNLVQYSTPLLFAAQSAMKTSLIDLFESDGNLPVPEVGRTLGVSECTQLLEQNTHLKTKAAMFGN